MKTLRAGLWLSLMGAQVSACSFLTAPSAVEEEDDDAFIVDEAGSDETPSSDAGTSGVAPTRDASTNADDGSGSLDEPTTEPPDTEPDTGTSGATQPDDGTPDDAVPDDGMPDDGMPDDAVPDDGMPDDAVPDDGVDETEPPPDPTDTTPPPEDTPFTIYTGWPFDADEAARRQQETADMLGLDVEFAVQLDDTTEMLFELIPAGEAVLGQDGATVPDVEGDEALRDYVSPRPYYMGKTSITREHYRALFGEYPLDEENAWFLMSDSPNEPVLRNYRWRDVLEPALQAKLPEGWTPRLPRKEEYEYSMRSGTSTPFYFGDTEADLARSAWYLGNSDNMMHDVGLLEPNAWNLYDMQGNIWHFVYQPEGDFGHDADPTFHLIMGCDHISPPFQNGCRASNLQISDRPQVFRYILDFPDPE